MPSFTISEEGLKPYEIEVGSLRGAKQVATRNHLRRDAVVTVHNSRGDILAIKKNYKWRNLSDY